MMIKISKIILSEILNIIYPHTCPVCENLFPITVRNKICIKCLKTLAPIKGNVCQTCGTPIKTQSTDRRCKTCKTVVRYFSKGCAMFSYNEEVKKLIHNFKFYYHPEYGKTLGKYMYQYVTKFNPSLLECDFIVPVPIHFLRNFARGYNQSLLLAKEISCLSGIPLLSKNLVRIKNTKQQSLLTAEERYLNVKDAFKIKNPGQIKDKKILLIDDLLTTGSTLNYCALTLKEAGANDIYILTLATSDTKI